MEVIAGGHQPGWEVREGQKGLSDNMLKDEETGLPPAGGSMF